tara:strand:- start:658 stop:879 length:222 start_codon:yes stop_codon:yes gene_type:complete
MAKVQKVASLLGKKKQIEKEIAKLQEECKHFSKSVRSTKEHVDSTTFIIRWVCDDCNKIIGIPNSEELDNYLN